jgi:hypothetical protein
MNPNFHILIDDLFLVINNKPDLTPIAKKRVLSIVNGFEDGKWRFTHFQNFIWDNIADTALSQKERESLIDQAHTKLIFAAKNLRLTDKSSDISQGSELAEIVLYGVMRNHYGALPVVPKIFYKQNSQDNAKGADSVHIVVDKSGQFSIWFGEAKFYTSIEDGRLATIIESVRNSLDTNKLKKENSIVTNIQDLDGLVSPEVAERIKAALDTNKSIDEIAERIHIPILLIHECAITGSASELNDNYKSKIVEYHKDRANAYYQAQVKKLATIPKYKNITFHLILIPVPSKQVIVDKFLNNVGHYKAQ